VAAQELRNRALLTDLEECERIVLAAAHEERAARAALEAGIGPSHPMWCEKDEEAYRARLARWQTASRTLVAGLNRLKNAPRQNSDR
jgi:hypothetical protein